MMREFVLTCSADLESQWEKLGHVVDTKKHTIDEKKKRTEYHEEVTKNKRLELDAKKAEIVEEKKKSTEREV